MTDLPRTTKGRATQARIVAVTTQGLVRERGATETSLDEVIERAAVSKGQLYHYFQDKADLLRAVVTHQADRLLVSQEPQRQALDGGARSAPGSTGWLRSRSSGKAVEAARSADRWEGYLR